MAAPLQGVIGRRRRPEHRGALVLLLLGVLFLGVGVVLGLEADDDRGIVAQDLGTLPGRSAGTTRSSADGIPVLSGLDELLPRAAGPATGPGVAGLTGGFDAPGGDPDGAAPGGTSPGGAAPGDTAQDGAGPGGAPTGGDAALRSRTADYRTMLADPVPSPEPARPAPRPMPQPPAPLEPGLPGLVSPIYPAPAPPAPERVPTPVLPATLDLPARALSAPVDAVGTAPSGGMVIPEEVRTVGWWAPGVLPGGTVGSAVIAGHVDSRTQGIGMLSVLPQLTAGEPVLVRDANGRTAAFRVAARREYGKYDLPSEIFSREGPPQLVLVTCGGRFDPATRSYESNIVVYAVPDPGSAPS